MWKNKIKSKTTQTDWKLRNQLELLMEDAVRVEETIEGIACGSTGDDEVEESDYHLLNKIKVKILRLEKLMLGGTFAFIFF